MVAQRHSTVWMYQSVYSQTPGFLSLSFFVLSLFKEDSKMTQAQMSERPWGHPRGRVKTPARWAPRWTRRRESTQNSGIGRGGRGVRHLWSLEVEGQGSADHQRAMGVGNQGRPDAPSQKGVFLWILCAILAGGLLWLHAEALRAFSGSFLGCSDYMQKPSMPFLEVSWELNFFFFPFSFIQV